MGREDCFSSAVFSLSLLLSLSLSLSLALSPSPLCLPHPQLTRTPVRRQGRRTANDADTANASTTALCRLCGRALGKHHTRVETHASSARNGLLSLARALLDLPCALDHLHLGLELLLLPPQLLLLGLAELEFVLAILLLLPLAPDLVAVPF